MAQSLTDFFRNSANQNVRSAKSILLQAISAVARQSETVAYLDSDGLQIEGGGDFLRAVLRPPAANYVRADLFRAPEIESSVWLQNQYALGVSFQYALAIATDHPAQVSGTDLGLFVPSLAGGFSEAIQRMVDKDFKKRFQAPEHAKLFVEGIGEGGGGTFVLMSLAALLVLVAAALTFIFHERIFAMFSHGGISAPIGNPGSDHPEPPKPGGEHEGMALVGGGPAMLPDGVRQVKDFRLDDLEVSIERYAAWARGAGRPLPLPDSYITSYPRRPVWNVAWSDADQFCQDAKERLPTEAEWTRAWMTASFPWGSGSPDNRANLESGELRDVGSTPGDKTASGIFDLAGNLPEWVSDSLQGDRIVRGGGYYLPASVATDRQTIGPGAANDGKYLRVGFRCASQ